MKILFWAGLADLLVNGDPVKRMLRFAAKRASSVSEKATIGFVFGNLELYGYFGCGSMLFDVIKNEWRIRCQKKQKSVTPAMPSSGAPKKNVPSAESSSPNLTKP